MQGRGDDLDDLFMRPEPGRQWELVESGRLTETGDDGGFYDYSLIWLVIRTNIVRNTYQFKEMA